MAKQTFTTGQVLTAAQMTSLQQTAMLGGAASAKTASYTLVAADAGTAVSMSNAGATTITVNTGLFAAGDTVQITNLGAGVCTITAGTATVNTSASLALAQYESGTLNFTSTSAAIFIKGAGAAATAAKSYTLINTGGTSLSGSSTQVSSLSGYNYLFVHIDSATANTAANFRFRMNADTGSNYYAANGDGDVNAMTAVTTTGANGGVATEHFIFIDAANSTGIKPFWFSAVVAAVGVSHGAGYYGGTSVISSFTALLSGGSFTGGTIKIYGAN